MSYPHLAFRLTHRVSQGRPVVQLIEAIDIQGFNIPTLFRTDFASIPTVVRWLIPVFGRSCKASLLHDWLCFIGINRRMRSGLFRVQMLADGVPAWQANLQWFAVRYWPGSEKITGEIVAAPQASEPPSSLVNAC